MGDLVGQFIGFREPAATGRHQRAMVSKVPGEEWETATVADSLALVCEMLGLIPSTGQIVVETQMHQRTDMSARWAAIAALMDDAPGRL
ncbi:hypothetical protein ACFROC_30585, partial [Nocardia tengchongensis]|uniref:hypothetical protein n=1 Tax=Nocardia tengchongensis TaxID=2055889 RepID=UPI0036A93525